MPNVTANTTILLSAGEGLTDMMSLAEYCEANGFDLAAAIKKMSRTGQLIFNDIPGEDTHIITLANPNVRRRQPIAKPVPIKKPVKRATAGRRR